MDQKIHTAINWLERHKIQSILQEYGFAVYDNDDTAELRECLRENVMDGTISEREVTQ